MSPTDRSIVKRALVTGATGFVGRRLIERLLAEGTAVRALVRDRSRAERMFGPAVETFVHDLTADRLGPEACAGVSVVFHLAGHAHAEDEGSGRSEVLHQAITVHGTRAVLECSRAAAVPRLVFLSSVKAVGESTGLAEDDGTSPRPTTAYGRAKRTAEVAVLESEAPIGVVVRSPLVYGPGVKGNLRQMMRAISRGRFPPVPRVEQRRSMIAVDDLVRALVLCAEHPDASRRAFIATDGETYSTRRLYEAMSIAASRPPASWHIPLRALAVGALFGDGLKRILGRPMPLDRDRLAKLFGSANYSNAALVELGFQPTHTLETSLPEMFAACRAEP